MTLVAVAATVWVLVGSGTGSGGLDASGPECVVQAGTAAPAATVGLSGTLLAGAAGGELAHADALSLAAVQLQHAATINAVGLRLDLPERARVIALATALQESSLRNLPDGDRDSLGLFQQRPSQGWGTQAQVQDPRYAATAFYTHLRRVPGWAALPVTEAAQRVQRSAYPDAYAQWEAVSRQLARALTGELPAGLACQFDGVPLPSGGVRAQQRATAELGPGGLGRTRSRAQTWATASWLVAHASTYGITTVSVAGRSWQAKRGTWVADAEAGPLVYS